MTTIQHLSSLNGNEDNDPHLIIDNNYNNNFNNSQISLPNPQDESYLNESFDSV